MPGTAGVREAGGQDPLRILQVTSTTIGGNWFFDQVRGLTELGNVVCAVLPREGPLADRLRRLPGVQVEIIPFGLSRRLRQLPQLACAEWQLARFIRAYRPDVIHAHLIIAILACRVAAIGYRRGLVVSQIPGLVHLRIRPLFLLDRMSLGLDDLTIGSCRAIADRYREMGARSVAVSYYGCDVGKFDPMTSPKPFRDQFSLDSSTPAVGMVAYMYPSRIRDFREIGVKGHEVFIDAVPLIAKRHPDARFFVVGDELIGNGDYRRILEARAAATGVGDRITFTGLRNDIDSVMAGLDILVNPSMDESACYTVAEALLMRKGVIATNVGGLPDTVKHHETGLLIPAADSIALAEAVCQLLDRPDLVTALAERGRKLVLDQFDIHSTVAQVDALYREALSKPIRSALSTGRFAKPTQLGEQDGRLR